MAKKLVENGVTGSFVLEKLDREYLKEHKIRLSKLCRDFVHNFVAGSSIGSLDVNVGDTLVVVKDLSKPELDVMKK